MRGGRWGAGQNATAVDTFTLFPDIRIAKDLLIKAPFGKTAPVQHEKAKGKGEDIDKTTDYSKERV